MKTWIINIASVLLGLFIGGALNMAIITIGPQIIPAPAGIDMTTEDGLKTGMSMLAPKHFIFPFLAHALGTALGAWIAAFIGKSHQVILAIIIGVLFLIGGIMAVVLLNAPMWYNILDLCLAYIPMAWIGYALVPKSKKLNV